APPPRGPVAEAIAYAGPDAVRFALARMPPGGRPPEAAGIARHVLANPAYAVRYAHAAAAAVLRWAAALGTRPAGFTPRLLAAPEDLNELHEEIWPRGARRSGGVLTLGGVDVRDLAADFGTPLYVCDEEDVRSRCREYLEAFSPDGRVFYAAKAFCSRAVLRWVSEEGLGVDVCTGGELEVARSAGVPP